MPLRWNRSGGGWSPTFAYALIADAQGIQAPFLYSAVEVEGGSGGVFTPIVSGRTWAGTLRNLAEIGLAGIGSAKMPIGSVLTVFTSPDGSWFFDRLHYRGTYG